MTLARYLAIAVALMAAEAVHDAADAAGPSNTIVWLDTSAGDILLEMQAPDVAPITVGNFLRYVDEGFYDGLIFHRVIEGFMIQGGGFDPNLLKKEPNDPIINESFNGLLNQRGTLAMARTDDPNSATSEFFINHQDNPSLDPDPNGLTESQRAGYCVFGRVLEGIDIVDGIAETNTDANDRPTEDILIAQASRIPVLVDVTTARYDPCSDRIAIFPGEEAVLSVRIENAGGESFDPNAVEPASVLTFLLVDQDGLLVAEPNVQLPALDAGEVVERTVTLSGLAERADYVLSFANNDSRVAGGFKLSAGMRQETVAISVRPDEADLLIEAPSSSLIYTRPGETVTAEIAVANTGRATADSFRVRLYLSTDPNFADDPNASADPTFPGHDPNAAAMGAYRLDSLDGEDDELNEISFSAPEVLGTYYLRARADDGNEVLEYDESNNLGETITLIVEPNAPDLIVLDPDDSEIATWTQAERDFPVTVRNIGGLGAGTFTVQLYLATDPNFSENDPGTQRIADADFVVNQLDERTSHSETLSVVMPGAPGTYYLRAVADDSNVVLEFDENNNAGAAVTLTVANRIDVTRLKAKAGADPNRDGFDLRGQLTNVGLDDLLDALTIDIEIGTYSQSLAVEGMPGLVGGRKYVYRGAKGFVTLAVFDMRTGKFRIVAKNISLRGTTAPVPVRISFADYVAAGEVADALINRGKGIPFRYQLGLADALRVDKYRYTTFASTRNKDSIRVSGRIALKDYPIDLSGKGVRALYGRPFTIAEGADGLRQKGTSEKYRARRSPSDGAAITKAVFNLEKCTFSIAILRKALLNRPPQVLTITLVENDEVIFEEVAVVGN